MTIKVNEKSDKRTNVQDTSALEFKYSQITNQKTKKSQNRVR